MADTPTSVETVTPVESIEDRVANLLGPEDDAPPVESPAQQQDIQETAAEELTPDDIPDETSAEPTPQAVEELPLTYNGEPIKVTKERATELAQKGLHLERATEKVLGELNAAQQRAQQLAQVTEQAAQAAPQLRQLQARMDALQMMADNEGLNPQNIYQVSLSDPARAQEMRARLDIYDHQYKQAQIASMQLQQTAQQHSKTISEQTLAAERQLLQRVLPQAKDPAKYTQVRQAMEPALKNLRPQTVQAIDSNAEIFAAFAKAAQYDALQAGKRASINKAQASPQPMKPGTPNAMDAKTRQSLDLRKDIKRATSSTDKARAIERFLETKF